MIDYSNVNIDGLTISNDIKERLKLLLTTRIGTVVLDRDFGLDMSFIDKPLPIAKQLYTIEVINKIKKYEPDLKVQKITFQKGDSIEKIVPKVKITIS